MDFDILRSRKEDDRAADVAEKALTPSVLSTVGLRRATESHAVKIENLTGLDLFISPPIPVEREVQRGTVRFDVPDPGFVAHGNSITLDSIMNFESPRKNHRIIKTPKTLSLKLAPSSSRLVGEREPVSDLIVESASDHYVSLHTLKPALSLDSNGISRSSSAGRASPETVLSEGTRTDFISDFAYYNAEPVIEWCFQLQRLRSSTSDVYSLQKGRDLLSSFVWSPEDEVNDNVIDFTHYLGSEAPVDQQDDSEATTSDVVILRASTPELARKIETSRAPYRSNWLRPYLKNDSPEWTDMTCILRMARERVMLPDSNWIWVNDWTADLSGAFGEETDADGWEYEADFETFTRNRRFYQRGDCCRRRRWTRTRMVKPPKLDNPRRLLKFVWATSRDETGNYTITVKSPLTIHNNTSLPLAFFVYSPSWDEDKIVGTASPGEPIYIPVQLTSAVYVRIAKKIGMQEFVKSDRVMILPTSPTSTTFVRTTMRMEDVSNTTLHFLVHVKSNKGIVDIIVEPVLRIVNLLPCELECQLGEVLRGTSDKARIEDSRPIIGSNGKRIGNAETLQIASGQEGKCTAVDPLAKPHISLRVPGYRWSPWQRIVNRNASSYTWRPSEEEEDWHISTNKSDSDYAEEFKSMVRFERTGKVGDPLILIISVECGHSPTVRIYAQYWILDKTGFGCRFCEGFTDLLGTVPDSETSRRSHLLEEEARDPDIQSDMTVPGHQWSLGMSGMSLYFSLREKFALSIESGAGDSRFTKGKQNIRSKWVSPMDVSNVIPKTVFSVEELGGPRRFELAISVTVCPGNFARTKLITLLPRYQIVNLLHRELVVAQAGCLGLETLIPSQSSVPFHWESHSGTTKVHLGAPSAEERDSGIYNDCFTKGGFQLDKIGITSMRLPTDNTLTSKPMVVQCEVRLATKDQSSAVVIVIWSANENSNPLYILRNRTPYTILCRQPLQDEPSELESGNDFLPIEACSGINPSTERDRTFQCADEVGPMIRTFLGLDRIEEFVWIMPSGGVSCFGFDDPEKPHILEWTCVASGSPRFDERGKKAFLEVDAMGSLSTLMFGNKEICCQIGAEHSTKMIEFFEVSNPKIYPSMPCKALRRRGVDSQSLIRAGVIGDFMDSLNDDDDEDVAFSLRVEVPAVTVSVIDNADPNIHGREILLAQLDHILVTFSQSREGYHEMELRLMSFQVDNHVNKAIHPVLVRALTGHLDCLISHYELEEY